MCIIEQTISLVPMLGPISAHVAAFTAPVVDAAKLVLKPALALVGALAISACGQPDVTPEGKPVPRGTRVFQPHSLNNVVKFCDQGRAIYAIDDDNSGAIAIVENATECATKKAE